MITSILSDHAWNFWEFNQTPKGIWTDMQMQREFLHHFAKELKMTRMEDWYNITTAQIYQHKGAGLFEKYQKSPSKMITSVLTDHEWDLWRFNQAPKGIWDDLRTRAEFMKYLTKELKIAKMEDWYHITAMQIIERVIVTEEVSEFSIQDDHFDSDRA
eukprot:TRINITY_DN4844_c0_g1_i1.p1 TRINITY_DN4844_c0_g1~~TRINITY_DN4844_c0_g1_i1.p1  ORF type:complete len:165 (-),score=29.29 TRINITY_DN4844_c0_g1_i1:56-529(-)